MPATTRSHDSPASHSRRWFVRACAVAGLTGSLAPLAGCGRSSAPPRTEVQHAYVGVLSAAPVVPSFDNPNHVALRDGFAALGYREGENLLLDMRYAAGNLHVLPLQASALLNRGAKVLIAPFRSEVVAAREVTDRVPIVMVTVGDPVADGLVESLARPGGNVTGLTTASPQLGGKQFSLLHETLPGMRRLAVLHTPALSDSEAALREVREAAAAARVEILPMPFRYTTPDELFPDLDRVFAETMAAQPDALLVTPMQVMYVPEVGSWMAGLVSNARLPVMSFNREWVSRHAGLMAYGPSIPDLWRRTAVVVDKLLRGATAATLPVERPTTFEFAINRRTAQTLGLTLPPSLLTQATHVQ